jgi:DNA ligase-associated metallophosphoesterase
LDLGGIPFAPLKNFNKIYQALFHTILNPCCFSFKNQKLWLLPQRAIYWEEEETILVSDLHLGKVGHFRKAGIPIPRSMEQEDLAELSDLIRKYKPRQLLILGDFFHSSFNQDWHWIRLWRDQFPRLTINLVKGNHDILSSEIFRDIGIELISDTMLMAPFVFSHIPIALGSLDSSSFYPISGHIHPGISLKGKGHQSRRLSCFYFGPEQGILPAFGRFTGTHALSINQKVHVFIINGNSVLPLPTNPGTQVI